MLDPQPIHGGWQTGGGSGGPSSLPGRCLPPGTSSRRSCPDPMPSGCSEHGGQQAAPQRKPQPLLTSPGQVPSALGSSPTPSCPSPSGLRHGYCLSWRLVDPTDPAGAPALGCTWAGLQPDSSQPQALAQLPRPPAGLLLRKWHRSSQHLAVLGLGRPLGPFVRPIPFGGRSLGIRPSSGLPLRRGSRSAPC